MEIGTTLRRLRDKMRISSRELAGKMDISLSTYMGWEHDKTSPSLRSYSKLARAFEMTPVELMVHLTGQNLKGLPGGEKSSLSELREEVI